MSMTAKINTIVAGVFGAILIFYLIANTFNDAGSQLGSINSSITGGSLMKALLPLMLAFGVVVAVWKLFGKS